MTSTSLLVQGTRRPLFMRSSTENTERKQGLSLFSLNLYCISRDFPMEPEFTDERLFWHTLLRRHICCRDQERRQTFHLGIFIVPVKLTPYQPGIKWNSWMFMEVKNPCGCWSLLLSALDQPKFCGQRGFFDWNQVSWWWCTQLQMLKRIKFGVSTRSRDSTTN